MSVISLLIVVLQCSYKTRIFYSSASLICLISDKYTFHKWRRNLINKQNKNKQNICLVCLPSTFSLDLNKYEGKTATVTGWGQSSKKSLYFNIFHPDHSKKLDLLQILLLFFLIENRSSFLLQSQWKCCWRWYISQTPKGNSDNLRL